MLKHKNNYITERDQIKESQIVQLCTCCVTFLCKKKQESVRNGRKNKKNPMPTYIALVILNL